MPDAPLEPFGWMPGAGGARPPTMLEGNTVTEVWLDEVFGFPPMRQKIGAWTGHGAAQLLFEDGFEAGAGGGDDGLGVRGELAVGV